MPIIPPVFACPSSISDNPASAMTLNDTLSALAIDPAVDVISDTQWKDAASRRPTGALAFAEPSFVRTVCCDIGIPGDMTEALLEIAGSVRRSESLSALAWYFHDALFYTQREKAAASQWPQLTDALGADAGLFNALIILSGTPQLQALYRERGISAEIFRDTTNYLQWHMCKGGYREDHGQWGLASDSLGWVAYYWRGSVFRIGRLTYAIGKSDARLRVFQHRSTGAVIALSENGIDYRADGQVNGAGDVFDKTESWASTLQIGDHEVSGYPIDPHSFAVQRLVTLSLSEWQQVLKPGDPVVHMHMAAGCPLDHAACGASLLQSRRFFADHFPEWHHVAYCCYSWVLDAQFEALLPPTSNLVRFQQSVYLYPVAGGNRETFETVFGRHVQVVAEAPRDTSMQRAFAGHIEGGGHFRDGGCFILPEHIPRWHEAVYRSQTLPYLAS